MPQVYTSQLTMPVEHKAVSIRNAAAVLNGVITLTSSNANGSDMVILHSSGATGLCKVAFQLVGDSAPTDPTAVGTDDATGVILQWTSANIPILFYAGRGEGLGKKKILAVKIFTPAATGTVYAQFIDSLQGVEING